MTNRKNTLDQDLLNQIITNRIGDHIKNTDNCFHEKKQIQKKIRDNNIPREKNSIFEF